MNQTFKSALCLNAAAITVLAMLPAHAQEASQAIAEPTSDVHELNDIVVTAQRRSENLQRAALPISAVTAQTLTKAGITKPTELTGVVPSLQAAQASGPHVQYYLRGVGNYGGTAQSDPAVAFNADGIYIGQSTGTMGFFYDLERVEVLKGPQGTLYGRNATGGAINVISRRPQFDDLGFDGSFALGNYNSAHVDAALNVPLGDTAALRAAGTYVKHDGYMKDNTDEQDDLGGRLSLRIEPSSDLSINLTGNYFQQRGNGPGGTPVELGIKGRFGYLSPEGQAFMAPQPNTVLGNRQGPYTAPVYLHNNFWLVSATIDWRTPIGTLTIVPGHREGRLNYRTDVPGFYITVREKDVQSSLEARLASDETHPLRYLLGAYYYHETNDVPYYNIYQVNNLVTQSYEQKTESKAVFGRLTYAIEPDIRLTVGARYSKEDRDLAGVQTGAQKICTRPSTFFPTYVPGCPTATAFPVSLTIPPPNFNSSIDGTITRPVLFSLTGANARSLSNDKFTYRLAADWDITPRNLLYASYETGFKSGGFFFTSDAGVFKPETIQAWTIGSKNRFLSNKLQFNLEVFYWRYKDQQISHVIRDSLGNTQFGTENVGRATYKGFEIDARYLLTSTTELNADVQYLKAKYNSFIYQTPNLNSGVDNGTSCPNVGAPGTSYVVNCSGKRPPFAPTWSLNVGASQTVALANMGRFVGTASGHYQTKTLTGLEFLPQETQSAYWLVNADVTYFTPGDKFSVTAFVNNAFDKTVLGSTVPIRFTSLTSASLRPPRTYGVRVGVHF